MPLAAGTQIGPYEIVEILGAGGMGEVYRARDRKLNRDVALKVLLDSGGAGHERLARFAREAQTLAALNHPHIAQVYGIEEDAAAGPSIAMELVPGRTLAEMMAAGPLPMNDALAIARQIADGLEAAHEAGLVHRDLKPANVKVRDDGTVKVLDFGIAKTAASGSGATAIDPSSTPTMSTPMAAATQLTPGSGGQALTQAGMIMGTPAYMSPEQAKGRPIDKRADIWAFGAILFEMITGRGPFHAEDLSDTLAAVLTRPIDLADLPANTPLRLRALIRRCLTRDPRQRLRDIGDARLVIDDIIAGLPEDAAIASLPAPERGWRRYAPWAVAAAAVVVAGVMGFRNTMAPAAAPPLVIRAATPLPMFALFAALSPDGRNLVFSSTAGPRGYQIMRRPLDRLEALPINGTDDGRFPVFSPDGKSIVFFSPVGRGIIRRASIAGGEVIDICEGTFPGGAAWGDDNTIAFSSDDGLMRVSANGGTPERLTTLDPATEFAHLRPQFIPGNRILFTIRKTNGTADFAVLEQGKSRVIAGGGDNGRFVASGFADGVGHLTYARDETVFALPFDINRLEAVGPEVLVIERVSKNGPRYMSDYTVSDNGVLVYSRAAANEDIAPSWLDRSGTVSPLAVTTLLAQPRLSPDGSRAVGMLIGEGSRSDLSVMGLARGTNTQLTSLGTARAPIWTVDGRRVVFAANVDKQPGVFMIEADGSTSPRRVFSTPQVPVPLAMTPDGRMLVYTERGRLMVRALDGTGDARPLHESPPGAVIDAHISPDGKWIVYTSIEVGRAEAYVHEFPGPGRRERVSTNGAEFARWVEGGRAIVYWDNAGATGNFNVMHVSVQTSPALQMGTPRALFAKNAMSIHDATADGARFLGFAMKDSRPTTLVLVTNWFAELRQKAPLATR